MIGATFAPTEQQANELKDRPPESLPQAIQVLRLRLPRVLGAQAPSSDQLLRAPMLPGAASAPVNAVVESVLASVLGGTPPSSPGAPGPGAAPMMASSPASAGAPSGGGEVQTLLDFLAGVSPKPKTPSIQYQDDPGAPMVPPPPLPPGPADPQRARPELPMRPQMGRWA